MTLKPQKASSRELNINNNNGAAKMQFVSSAFMPTYLLCFLTLADGRCCNFKIRARRRQSWHRRAITICPAAVTRRISTHARRRDLLSLPKPLTLVRRVKPSRNGRVTQNGRHPRAAIGVMAADDGTKWRVSCRSLLACTISLSAAPSEAERNLAQRMVLRNLVCERPERLTCFLVGGR